MPQRKRRRQSDTPSKSDLKAVELQAQLAAQSGELAKDEGYQHFRNILKLAQNRHPYSFGNWFLIYLQLPTATIVMPYHEWKKAGRQPMAVEDGGQPLYILKPHTKLREVENEKGDKERRPVIVAFGSTHTYDITSTTGPDIPAPKKLTGEGSKEIEFRLIESLQDRGYKVDRGPTGGADGFTDPIRKEVVVDPKNPPLHQLSTLVHEFHHIEMGHTAEGFDYREHRGKAELEAEGATFIAMGLLGFDTSPDSVHYVTGWADGDIAKIMATAERTVKQGRKTAELLEPSLRRAAEPLGVEQGIGIEKEIIE